MLEHAAAMQHAAEMEQVLGEGMMGGYEVRPEGVYGAVYGADGELEGEIGGYGSYEEAREEEGPALTESQMREIYGA